MCSIPDSCYPQLHSPNNSFHSQTYNHRRPCIHNCASTCTFCLILRRCASALRPPWLGAPRSGSPEIRSGSPAPGRNHEVGKNHAQMDRMHTLNRFQQLRRLIPQRFVVGELERSDSAYSSRFGGSHLLSDEPNGSLRRALRCVALEMCAEVGRATMLDHLQRADHLQHAG